MDLHRCYSCMEMISEKVCPHCGYSQDQTNDSNQLPVGTLLRDQYLVGKVLGQGGFGITYMGWDTYLDMTVAIKEFFPASAVNRDVTFSNSVRANTGKLVSSFTSSRERFLREGRLLAKLNGIPEIVRVHSLFAENNTAYLVMEYINGTDLRRYVRQHGGKLQPNQILPVLQPLALALDAVHRAGLVHRDISPDNIMIQKNGVIKLLDFGAARDLGESDADIDLSHSTEAILKHGFAPAEQYRNRGNLGPWTDEYGFCATVYFCLTGTVPPDALVRLTDDFQPDWDIPGLTESQRAALEKGMSMRAKERFGSMKAFHDALYGVCQSPVSHCSESYAAKPDVVVYDAAGVQTRMDSDASDGQIHSVVYKKKNSLPLIACVAAAALIIAGVVTLGSRGTQNTGASLSVPSAVQEGTSAPESDTQETDAPTVTASVPWESNVLMSNPLSLWSDQKADIKTVSFLENLNSAPSHAVDVSADHSGKVLGWLTDGNMYFAADQGINARECCPGLFQGCSGLSTVTFGSAFHTDQATSMEAMFAGCLSLESVDTSSLVTGNVLSMQQMFDMRTISENPDGTLSYKATSTSALTSLDLSNWDVSSVKSMAGMFCNCVSLQTLDLHGWDVSNVRLMNSMFGSCGKLKSLDLSHWDVSNVTNMNYMFMSCSALESLDIGSWDVSSLISMNHTFAHCKNLAQLELGSWNVSNVTHMIHTFSHCTSLKELDVSKWNVSQVLTTNSMFASCSSLQTLDVSSWNVSNVRDMSCMFSGIRWELQPDILSWNVSRVAKYDSFFSDGRNINGMRWSLFFPDEPVRDSGSGSFSIETKELDIPLYDSYKIKIDGNVLAADMKWSSSNTEIVEVSEAGIISAYHPGTAIVTASYADKTITITVHVS